MKADSSATAPQVRIESAIRVAGLSTRPGRDSEGGSIYVGLEQYGAAFIEAFGQGTGWRLVNEKVVAMEGLRLGGAWPFGQGYLVQAFRDPFASSARPSSPGAESGPDSLFVLFPSKAEVLRPPFLVEEFSRGFELFALLSDPRGRGWLAQFRNSMTTPVQSDFVAIADLDSTRTTVLDRAAFESALRPRPIEQAPASVQAGLAALDATPEGGAILRVGGSDGTDDWYQFGPEPGAGREIHGWIDPAVGALIVDAGGQGVFSSVGKGIVPLHLALDIPIAGASFRSCAFLATGRGLAIRLLMVFAWEREEAEGPALSGILVRPLAVPR
jgi:hypothetical protein